MIKRANIQWTAKALVKNYKDGNINFDCAIQRSIKWDMQRKSLLIHSMIESYPIPAFYFAQCEGRMYDGLDGKQRTHTIVSFLDGEWPLDENFIVTDKDDEEHNFSKFFFAELPEWAQDAIKDYSLTIFYFDGLTEEQYQEMFYRLNNGMALTSVELTRVRTQALKAFQEMAKHDMVDLAVTEKGRAKFNHENLVMQAWAVCFALDDNDSLSFETRVFRPFMETAEVNEIQMSQMMNYFNIIMNMYNACNQKDKAEKKVAVKIKTRTHFVSLTRAVAEALGNDYEIDHLIDWVKVFFSGRNGSSQDAIYNNCAMGAASGTAKREKINARLNAMVDHMHSYMMRIEQRNAGRVTTAASQPIEESANAVSDGNAA